MIRIKELLKMYGTVLLCFGAVTVATIFLNFNLDLSEMSIAEYPAFQIVYDAQLAMSKVTAACAGGVLGAVALIVLLFSISHYIDENESNMGILKAIGYSERSIALEFLKYGLPVFIGTALGYAAGMFIASPVYKSISEIEEITPELSFHINLPLLLVVAPTVICAFASVLFAQRKLNREPLDMIKGVKSVKITKRTLRIQRENNRQTEFLSGLKRTMRTNHPVLILFVGIASWGFSAMLQMSFTMISIEMSDTAPMICAPIGIMMGFVTLIIAINFVIGTNKPYISLMKAYGYTESECNRTLFDGYRPAACIGFAAGTLYQYFLMKFMVSLFAGAYDVVVNFSIKGFVITLLAFILYYEGVLYFFKRKVSKISLREVMAE